jgi:hypothetical protein
MKRGALLRALKKQGCVFVEHCKKHDRYLQPPSFVTLRHENVKGF